MFFFCFVAFTVNDNIEVQLRLSAEKAETNLFTQDLAA